MTDARRVPQVSRLRPMDLSHWAAVPSTVFVDVHGMSRQVRSTPCAQMSVRNRCTALFTAKKKQPLLLREAEPRYEVRAKLGRCRKCLIRQGFDGIWEESALSEPPQEAGLVSPPDLSV